MSPDVLITRPSEKRPVTSAQLAVAAGLDVLAVLVFAAVGRASHAEGWSLAGTLDTSWPYLVGVAGGWLGIALTRWHPFSWAGACMVLVKTVVLGAALRVVAQSETAPLSFLVVSAVVLGALFFGWRAAARLLEARRPAEVSAA